MTRRDGTISFGCFLQAGGQHVSGWRHPDAYARGQLDIRFVADMTKVCERGLMDAVFIADSVAAWMEDHAVMARTTRGEHFEPTTLLAALSGVTSRIGLVGTATTTYNQPYHIARKFASLDHLSHGRAGWNVVTSLVPSESRSFGLDPFPSRSDRYGRAEEFVDVVRKLWNSYADEAMVRDKATGMYFDIDGLTVPDHRGERFAVRGPLNMSRPPQGHPVIFQAGNSDRGRQFSATYGDVLFTAQSSLDEGREFYRDVKGRAEALGRDPDDIVVWRGYTPLIAPTTEQAQAQAQLLTELTHPDVLWDLVKGPLPDIDLTGRSLDDPLPNTESGPDSRRDLLHGMAGLDRLTIREIAVMAAGAGMVAGTAQTIADELELWFDTKAADGFLVAFPYLPGPLTGFVDEVIPELQRRGRYRTAYPGTMLRENLDLPRPKREMPA